MTLNLGQWTVSVSLIVLFSVAVSSLHNHNVTDSDAASYMDGISRGRLCKNVTVHRRWVVAPQPLAGVSRCLPIQHLGCGVTQGSHRLYDQCLGELRRTVPQDSAALCKAPVKWVESADECPNDTKAMRGGEMKGYTCCDKLIEARFEQRFSTTCTNGFYAAVFRTKEKNLVPYYGYSCGDLNCPKTTFECLPQRDGIYKCCSLSKKPK